MIVVPPGAGIIRDLNVQLSISHSFNADLDVVLTHVASGTSAVLFTDVGNNDDGFLVQLDDASGNDIGGIADDPNDRAISGTFNPEGTALLAAFNGIDASGEWRLSITDDSVGDTGITPWLELASDALGLG
jgi:subtilisin-like proprotein convertase family protein